MNKDQILIRLKRAEGQLRGIQKMIQEDRYCIEVLQQISAVQSATENVAIALLENQTRVFVKNAIEHKSGENEIQEMIRIVKQFVK